MLFVVLVSSCVCLRVERGEGFGSWEGVTARMGRREFKSRESSVFCREFWGCSEQKFLGPIYSSILKTLAPQRF